MSGDVWTEYERRKRELPPLEPHEYAEQIRKITTDLGI